MKRSLVRTFSLGTSSASSCSPSLLLLFQWLMAPTWPSGAPESVATMSGSSSFQGPHWSMAVRVLTLAYTVAAGAWITVERSTRKFFSANRPRMSNTPINAARMIRMVLRARMVVAPWGRRRALVKVPERW